MILPKQPSDSSSMSSIVENLVTNLLANPGVKCSNSTQTPAAVSPEQNTSALRTERDASPTPHSLHSPKVSTPTASTSLVYAEEFLSAEERTHSENVTPKGSVYASMVPLSRSTPTRSSPNSALPFQSPLSFAKNEATSSILRRGNDETSPPKKQKLE